MKTTTLTELPTFNVPHAVRHLRAITPGATAVDLGDLLSAKLQQLSASLKIPYGESGETFRTFSDTIQDNYLWGCSALADECLALFEQVAARAPAVGRV